MDYKLVFRLHADIEANTSSYVPVLIWRISKADEKRLGRYKGVKGGYYHQEKASVVLDDGKELVAIVHIMSTQNTVSPPDAGYYQSIDDGYEHFGFDKKILETALAESIEMKKNA